MKQILNGCWFFIIIMFYLCSCEETNDNTIQAEITHFSVWDQRSNQHELYVDNVNNIITNKKEIPIYVNLSRLIAEFRTNTPDAILKVDDKMQHSGQSVNDFSKEIVYDLYVADIKQKSYTVKITKEKPSNNFSTFTFPEKQMEQYQPVINMETGEISNENEIPLNIDITSLKPEFTTRETDAVVKVNGVVQTSGVNEHDFSKPVVYTIEGQDGTSKEFTVKLKKSNKVYFVNPIIEGDYPDPTVIRVGNEFYLYVTGGLVRGYKSTDLINWEPIGGFE